MTNYPINQLLCSDNLIYQTVTINGWVRSRRSSKAGISFIMVHDGSGFDPIQVIAPSSLDNYDSEISKLTKDCSVIITGILVESQGKGQNVEIQAASVEVIGWVEDPDSYPISPKRHTLEHLRSYAHLRPRTNIIGAITRLRHCLAQAIHSYLHQRGFFWIHTPIITANDCEGAGELFRVSALDFANLPRLSDGSVDFSQDFFGKETFLTVSGQLNVESYCLAMSKVYTFGPTFRAENSNTSRHLAEFWMVEPEIAFADLNDDATLAEDMLQHVVKTVLDERSDDIDFFTQRVDSSCRQRLETLTRSTFERMSYSQAITILQQAKTKFDYPVSWGLDLQSEHERYLCEQHVKAPVTLTDYPETIKPFYMRLNDDQKTVAAMDVLVPGVGEIIGGSQREERLEMLDQRMQAHNLDPKDYSWYRDLRRYGSVPHAGFGLGLERLLSYITGVGNVRDLIPFPRIPGHADF